MSDWKLYRTRFLVKATQLSEHVTLQDAAGQVHSGLPGDYLVECSDGSRRISPRHVFEDVYVEMSSPPDRPHAVPPRKLPVQQGNPAD